VVVVVMLIDFLLMYFIRPVMRALGLPLSLLGIVLSVFQVALSIQFGLLAIRTIAAHGI
jgi:small neutral amino acid transporter SnatA (MarC family)